MTVKQLYDCPQNRISHDIIPQFHSDDFEFISSTRKLYDMIQGSGGSTQTLK